MLDSVLKTEAPEGAFSGHVAVNARNHEYLPRYGRTIVLCRSYLGCFPREQQADLSVQESHRARSPLSTKI